MNKQLKIFIFILILLIPLVTLTSCYNIEADEPKTAQEKLALLLNTLQNNTQQIDGSMHYNDKLYESYSGIMDKNALKMSLKINDTSYYYSSKVLLKSAIDDFIVEDPSTTLAQQKELLPFNLMYYSYSDGNSDNIFMTSSTINISFVNMGAKLSFESTRKVQDGYLSISFKNDNIINSVFTSLEGDKKITTYYSYKQIDYSFIEVPKAVPSDTSNYATYALSLFSKKYENSTIHTKDNFNTEAKMSDIIVEKRKIKSVLCVDLTGKKEFYTITLNYNVKQIIEGVGSAITTITIGYNKDYEINYLKINTTEYVLS